MEKMIGYIFGSLQASEAAIGGIVKTLKQQNKINKIFALSMLVGAGYIYSCETQRKKYVERIESLTKDIEELKLMKGE